jgi:hypothetical protein
MFKSEDADFVPKKKIFMHGPKKIDKLQELMFPDLSDNEMPKPLEAMWLGCTYPYVRLLTSTFF